ncbi:hypothetical protein BD770DRAFT_397469 [Pilaira anomala]|nr:hypothetical protein BD770DRAFT_397469 [Pilaira anomala]
MTATETTTKTDTLSLIEQKVLDKLEVSKSWIDKIYVQWLPYLNAIQTTMQTLWQYPEFRVAIYIFGTLSLIPVIIFLLFILTIILTTSIILCVLWSIIIFSTAAFGLIILTPILLTLALAVLFLVISFDTFQYIRLKSQK